MYAGLSRAVSYCLLSLEAGMLAERATRAASVQIYQQRTADQCIVHQLIVEIAQNPGSFYAGLASGIAGNYLTKFIDLCFKTGVGSFKTAVGSMSDHEYESRLKGYERVEPFFDDLVDKLEPHLLAVHAPIQDQELVRLQIGAETIEFSVATKDFWPQQTSVKSHQNLLE